MKTRHTQSIQTSGGYIYGYGAIARYTPVEGMLMGNTFDSNVTESTIVGTGCRANHSWCILVGEGVISEYPLHLKSSIGEGISMEMTPELFEKLRALISEEFSYTANLDRSDFCMHALIIYALNKEGLV